MAARKALKLGDIQAFIQYSRQFTQPIAQTANIANVLQSTLASAERVLEVLEEDEQCPSGPTPWPSPCRRGHVEFRHVRFGYKEDAILMQDMNIKVEPGQTIAIVGPTGAGKTTLVNLLMRFYEISGGAILIDGIDTRDMQARRASHAFRHGPPGHLALQRHDPREHRLRPRGRHRRRISSRRPRRRTPTTSSAPCREGYDTALNEEASNISQGEKQLLTIARAILSIPAILILDEATSSVDTRTEVYIQKAMKTLMRGPARASS